MPAVSVKEIAEFLGATVEGEGDLRLVGVKPLGEAAGDELSFLANPKYAPLLDTTTAGAVLVPPDTLRKGGATFIRVADPYLSLAKVVQRWFAEVPGPQGISPHASIDGSASIGDGTRIGPLAAIAANVTIGQRVTIHPGVVIGEESTIGDDTVIYPNVTIYHRSVIGARCIVHSGVVIGSDGYGFATAQGKHHKIPQIGRVRIGDDVEIGSNTTIDRAALGETVIGDGTKVDNLVQIAHNVKIGRHCLIVAQVGIAGSTEIGDNCVFGGQAGAAGHLKIGSQVQVAAKATLMKDFDGPATLGGFPARPLSEHMRVEAAKNRLPDLLRRIREIEKKLELRPGSNENQG